MIGLQGVLSALGTHTQIDWGPFRIMRKTPRSVVVVFAVSAASGALHGPATLGQVLSNTKPSHRRHLGRGLVSSLISQRD